MSPTAPPDPTDKAEWGKYWENRQKALGIETHGETLTSSEVMFCERLIARYPGIEPSSILEWLARDRYDHNGDRLVTNDFVWLNNGGGEWELKSPHRPKYSSIRRAINDDVLDGKTSFLIDLGSHHLEAGLRDSLTRYGRKRGVSQLVMLSGNGSELSVLI